MNLERDATELVAEEDLLRVYPYRLLGRFLARPPDAGALALASSFTGDETELGQALAALGRIASRFTPEAARDEYTSLFIGLGRGELVPYGSYYLTGFLYEQPLARLRDDMGRLGIARTDDVKEPEDHIAALCEMMAGLIAGDFGTPADIGIQREFFDTHMAPWAGRFFADLEAAKCAVLYAPVGTVGRVFMDIEATAFAMAA